MSYVMAAPEMIATAATDVAAIGSTLNAAHSTAAPATVGVIPAAADEVSTGIAQLFSQHAQDYQALAAQAAAFQQQFVQHLNASAGSYTAAEAANAAATSPSVSSIASAIASMPGQFLSEFTGFFDNYVKVFETFLNSFELSAYVAYELLIFSYLTFAILIELEMLGLKALGVSIPIP